MLETVVALSLFLIVAMSAANLLLIASGMSSRLIARQELLENARIAMDFMSTNIAMAEEITLSLNADGTLDQLRLKETDSSGSPHTYVYQYDSSLPFNHTRYHRLEMGGNELASFIAFIGLEADAEQEFITLHIKTDDKLQPDGAKLTDPIVLTEKIKIKYKKVTIH